MNQRVADDARGRRRMVGRGLSRLPLYVVALLAALICLFPFYWTLAGSMMSPLEIYSNIPRLWPAHATFDAYQRVAQLVPIARWFLNSIITAVSTMVVAVLVSSAAGYCFAQLRFLGKRVWFALILATLMVPYQSRIIPLFVMFNGYGLSNSYLGIILPGLASALGAFMMTQFFKGVPGELREAALIDGASELRVFFQVYLPVARPAVATLALLMFLQSWDQLLWPLIIAPTPDMRTLQVGLAYITQYAPTVNYEMAAIVLSVVPVIVAFLLAQRHFVAGIAAGAVKE
ncbi:MAG: carbohydrate ABC transporter permease [Candidatus Dormiibacterota bacterium]